MLRENKRLQARIVEFERRLGLNSSNSNKLPSSDGPGKSPRVNTKSLRERGKKPSDGQWSHEGTTLKQVAHPDTIVFHALLSCSKCYQNLEEVQAKQRLKNHRADVLRFLIVAEISFSNNQAKQDLRMMKVKQKISGGFRVLGGAEVFVRIRSFISTMRKQEKNIFDFLIPVDDRRYLSIHLISIL